MAAAYDDYDYPRYWTSRAYEHVSEVIALDKFFKKIGRDKKIIDIGAGYGRLAQEYEKYSRQTTLVDPSRDLLIKAKKIFTGSKNKTQYIQSTIQNLGEKVKNKKYDVVVLVRVMHHIKNPETAIKAVADLLPIGGYFVLEFANKLHGKAIIKNILSGNFTFQMERDPQDKRSKRNIQKGSILFLNHHPDVIDENLKKYGFKIIDKRSVSNIRSRFVKRNFSLHILKILEQKFQKPLAKINFGPSIFILAKKMK